jgi:hypothetical protein
LAKSPKVNGMTLATLLIRRVDCGGWLKDFGTQDLLLRE